MDRGTLKARDGNESAIVETVSRFSHRSLSLSLSLFLFFFQSVLRLSFPNSPLLAAFSSFHTPLSQFSSPTGPELYNRSPLPAADPAASALIAEIARTFVSKKKKRLGVSRRTRKIPESNNCIARIRASSSVNAFLRFLLSFFFFSKRVEFLATSRNAISFSLSHRRNLVEVLARFLFRFRECRHSLIYYAHTYTTVLFYLREFITYSARNASLCFRNAPA